MRRFLLPARLSSFSLATAFAFVAIGCGGCGGDNGGSSEFITIGTAPVGGAFAPVGNAIAAVLDENKGANTWTVQAKGTKGSKQNIVELDNGTIQFGLSNSSITYYAYRGELEGDNKKYNVRAVMTLSPNVAMFLTRKELGIKSIAELKGKRVYTGPAGAGFEMFIRPIVNEHGLKWEGKQADFTPVPGTQTDGVSSLADDDVQAAFLGGAPPTASISQACNEMDVFFIPFDEQAKENLINDYPFFEAAELTVEKYGKQYKDMTEDFEGLNVGSMHLITSTDMDAETIYQLTKAIWENREEIGKQHAGVGEYITKENVANYTGTPFHKGAVRFYKEIGAWPMDQPEAAFIDGE
jgi:hypothetical protein